MNGPRDLVPDSCRSQRSCTEAETGWVSLHLLPGLTSDKRRDGCSLQRGVEMSDGIWLFRKKDILHRSSALCSGLLYLSEAKVTLSSSHQGNGILVYISSVSILHWTYLSLRVYWPGKNQIFPVTCVYGYACYSDKQVNNDQSIVHLPQFHDREQNLLSIYTFNDHFVASMCLSLKLSLLKDRM